MRAGITIEDEALTFVNLTGLSSATTSVGRVNVSHFYQELLMVEEELLDQHVSGQVSADDRKQIETHFLNAPERREKLRFAKSLRQYIRKTDGAVSQPSTVPTPLRTEQRRRLPFWFTNPIISYAVAIAILVVISGVSWLALYRIRQSNMSAPGNMITEVIKSGSLTRDGGEVKQVSVPRGTTLVRLLLELPAGEYDAYRAVILGEEGNEIFATGPTKPEIVDGRKVLSLQLESRSLPPGDYQIKLSGVAANGTVDRLESYRFRVRAS